MNICHECNKNFSNKYILATHQRNIHGPARERNFCCNFESSGVRCTKRFMTKHHLAKHQEIVHNTTDKNFCCPTCNKKFKSANNLTTHQKSHHKSFLCRYCNATFFREEDVRFHENAIHEKNIKYHPCNECSPIKLFSQQSNLLSHIKSVHRKVKVHNCHLCKNSYARKRLLDYHLSAAHQQNTEIMTLNCSECTFTTIYPSHLIKHRKSHLHKDDDDFSASQP